MDKFLRKVPRVFSTASSDNGLVRPATPDDGERPAKKPRLVGNSNQFSVEASPCNSPAMAESRMERPVELPPMDDEISAAGLESALPELVVEDETVGDYEATLDSQGNQDASTSGPMRPSPWIKGKRSLYVDAFNFALDTVLEDEAHLFDNRERHVFSQWKGLDYEAQYL